MTLAAGSRLGPYEIVSPLGAGGMGEVYRARDLRLGRHVAVKVLPDGLASDTEALARFEREAKAVAALSHPGICTLHDVGREAEVSFLVMELLEGETLADRVLRGPLPLDQALKIGAEIGSALAAAHEKNIAHRDLKPGNVMLTRSGVKLLDFGLAKALAAGDDGPEQPAATGTVDVTQEGTLLGTLPYMAPEQVEGRRADARTDIFALGAVLYEMATGRRAFSGRTQASLISAILGSEPPPISSIRPLSPPGLDHLVRTCLAKGPGDRWQSARDVVLQIRALSEAQPTPAPAARGEWAARFAWTLGGIAVALVATALFRGRPSQAPPSRTIRLTVPPPPGGAFTYSAESTPIAVSPDGLALAYAARDAEGARRLWVRSLASTEARLLAGSEEAVSPFWSPDGRSLAFFAQSKLKRLDLAGGTPITICDVPPGAGFVGTWGRERILFVSPGVGNVLYSVPIAGGTASVELEIDRSKGEDRFGWPSFLPNGECFVYSLRRGKAWDLMLAEPGRPPRAIGAIASKAQYAGPGHLVFVREGTLLAQRFDSNTGRLTGEPIAVAKRVRYFMSTASAAFSASPAGTIAYQSEGDVSRLVWLDRAGRGVGSIGPPGEYLSVAISPDGQRVLYDRARPDTGTWDVWASDLERQVESRLTSDPETEVCPQWLPGGAIVYSARRSGPPQLVRRDLATGREEELLPPTGFQIAEDVSPDGRTLVYSERTEASGRDVWELSLSGERPRRALLQTAFDEAGARFSSDGRFLAFLSDESGRPEAYVMPYPGPGERVRVSTGGARAVRWSHDGRELLLLARDGRLWSLLVRTTPAFQAGAPKLLFGLAGNPANLTTSKALPLGSFAVTPDGQRLLAVVPEIVGNEQPVTLVVDWAAETAR